MGANVNLVLKKYVVVGARDRHLEKEVFATRRAILQYLVESD